MARKPTIHCAVVCTLVLSFGVFSVIGVGVMSVDGAVWSVGEVNDISIGNNESQTIRDIKILDNEKDVKIRVGEFVNRGAKFDKSNSSYTITNRKDVDDSEVYIKNHNNDNATVVVNRSVLDESGIDVKISNISTRDVNLYGNRLSPVEKEIKYGVEQGFSEKFVRFDIHSPADINIHNVSFDEETGKVDFADLKLIRSTDYVVIWKRSDDGKLIQQLGKAKGAKEQIEIAGENISGKTEIAATIHPGRKQPSVNTIYSADNRTVQFPIPVEVVGKPIHYTNTGSEKSGKSVLSVPFNTNVSNMEGNVRIHFYRQANKKINLRKDSKNYEVDGSNVDIFLGNSTDQTNKDSQFIKSISINCSGPGRYLSKYPEKRYPTQRVAYTIENRTTIDVLQGSHIRVDSNGSDEFSLISEEQIIQQNATYKHENNIIINTSSLSDREYEIRSESDVNRTRVSVVNASLSPTVPTTSITHGIFAKFSSTQVSRPIAVDLTSNAEFDRDIIHIEKHNKTDIFISVSKEGRHKLNFTDINTGETIHREVTVLENKNLTLNFPTSIESVPAGHISSIVISPAFNSSTINIIDVDTNTTAATINLTTLRENRTTLRLNTYAAATESLNDSVTVSGSGASIESVTTLGENETLSSGTYEVRIRSEQGIVTTSDNATLTLTERSTNGLTTYAGPGTNRSGLETAAAVRDAIEGDTLSRAERIGENETVVYAVNASGLTGLPAARNVTLESGDDLDRLRGIEFGVRSTTGNAATAEDAVGRTPRPATVSLDDTGLYVVADAEDALPLGGEPEPGEEFVAEFRVTDDRLREAASDPPDGHRVTSTVSFVGGKRDGSREDNGKRPASGSPVAGGGGSGGGAGVGGGTTGGPESTRRGGAGGTSGTGGTGGASSAAGAGGASGADEAGSTGAGAGGGPRAVRPPDSDRPNAEGRAPVPEDPFAVSVPTAAEASGASEPSDPDGSATETETTGAGNGGSDTSPAASSEPVGDSSERPTPTYENAPIRTTAEDVPGFGASHSLAALSLAMLAVTLRRRDH